MATPGFISRPLCSATTFAMILLAAFAVPSLARAEGFTCTSVDQDTKINVYFEPGTGHNESGPRASKMIISDPTVKPKNQFVAAFKAVDGLLNNSESVIVAYVDLSNPLSSRRGERVGGTTLGSLHSIILDIDYSYQEPVKFGTQLAGQVIFLKNNGEELTQDFDCIRYDDVSKMAPTSSSF